MEKKKKKKKKKERKCLLLSHLATIPLTRSQNDPGLEINTKLNVSGLNSFWHAYVIWREIGGKSNMAN